MLTHWTIDVCPECGEQVPKYDMPDDWRWTGISWLHRHAEFSPVAYIRPEPIEVVKPHPIQDGQSSPGEANRG